MQLKQVWAQKLPSASIFAPLPTSIAHRLEDGGEYAWPALMQEVEAVGHFLPGLGSTVVANSSKLTDKDLVREALKWYCQLEIEIMKKSINYHNNLDYFYEKLYEVSFHFPTVL